MSKAKFTYDESGATFFYFVLSFLALILVPSTYYFWPNEPQDEESKLDCRCSGCANKRQQLNNQHKWKRSRRKIVRGIIVIGWLAFVLIAYKCATAKHEYVNWDPFEILGVREDASPNDIKKAYRKLSLIFHPDKGSGDPDKFVKITKAYAALTDDEARKNWELYGNPDGPGATSFGIALPSWIVEKENSFVVLGIYALIFMVALPVSVGVWWYRSVKFGNDKVLINTTEVYYYFIHKTPNMALKRVIMILSASLEFAKTHNPEVIERPTDNQEMPRLMRDLTLLGEKNTEKPLCFSYSIKTRAILHAHLSRMKLPPNTLEVDRRFITQKCPYLLQEFVHCIAQLITLALSGRISNMPNLSTLEHAMKLGPLIVQALWEYQSPLLQLPQFSEDALRQLERKKIKIRSTEQLARMKESERREALKNFTDAQYEDIKFVLGNMPLVQVQCRFEVLDDEDPGVITAGSIVTAVVKLKRRQMRELFDKENTEITSGDGNVSDVEEDWDKKFQEKVIKKQKVFESKPKKSHPVHCPYFPDDKQEFWWVYIVDRKRFALITAPLLVTNLVDTEEVELKFTAPNPGVYSYTIVVRSDSYVDCTIQKQARIDVKPAREYIEADYDIPEDEIDEEGEEEHSSVEDSDLLTDTDDE
jgi:translocation protein SEC63